MSFTRFWKNLTESQLRVFNESRRVSEVLRKLCSIQKSLERFLTVVGLFKYVWKGFTSLEEF